MWQEIKNHVFSSLNSSIGILLAGFIVGWFLEPSRLWFNERVQNILTLFWECCKRMGKIKYKLSQTGVVMDRTGHSIDDMVHTSIVPSIDIEVDSKNLNLFADYEVNIFILDTPRKFKTYHNWLYKKGLFGRCKVYKINSYPFFIRDAYFIDNEHGRGPYYKLYLNHSSSIKIPLVGDVEEFVEVFIYINDKLKIKEKVKITKTGECVSIP